MIKPGDDKRAINAPCGFEEWDERKRRTDIRYPSVDCDHFCQMCGWNPKEQERRLKTGKFVPRKTRRNSTNMEIVRLPKGTQTLRFKRYLPT